MLDVVAIDTRDMERGVESVLESAETRSRTFFEGVKPTAKRELRRYTKERRGPDGQRWAPRSQASIERAKRGGKRKRYDSQHEDLLGDLATAYSWTADADGLVGEHKVPWGAAHHEGATVGRGAKLPARPFAGFSSQLSDEVREAWLAWVGKGW